MEWGVRVEGGVGYERRVWSQSGPVTLSVTLSVTSTSGQWNVSSESVRLRSKGKRYFTLVIVDSHSNLLYCVFVRRFSYRC